MSSNPTRKKNARHRLTSEQGGRCYYCGVTMTVRKRSNAKTPPNYATLDHIIPRSKGGVNAPSQNCVAACLKCNAERGNRDAREFLFEKMGLWK